MRDEQGQAVIEFTLALLVVTLLFGGTVAVWTWMNRSLIWRQRRYEDTRTWNTTDNRNEGVLPGLDYYPPEPLVE